MSDRDRQFGPGFTATFLYYFASTAFLTTFIASKALSITVSTGLPQQLGLVMGLFAGTLGGYFNRTVTMEISVKTAKDFFRTLEASLADMGYAKVEPANALEENLTVYQRKALGKILSGKIYVQLNNGSATVASRAIHIRRLRKLLNA